jgi:hypothetical protein
VNVKVARNISTKVGAGEKQQRDLGPSSAASVADELDSTKTGFRVITFAAFVSSGLRPSAITRPDTSYRKKKYKSPIKKKMSITSDNHKKPDAHH